MPVLFTTRAGNICITCTGKWQRPFCSVPVPVSISFCAKKNINKILLCCTGISCNLNKLPLLKASGIPKKQFEGHAYT
jgi:hypothetical protein